jgi:hypothetical protein
MTLKVRKKSGRISEYPAKKVKSVLKTTGYSGKLLLKATGSVLKEAKKLAKNGIIGVTDLEKAIVRGVHETNKIAMNTTQKIAKRVLK